MYVIICMRVHRRYYKKEYMYIGELVCNDKVIHRDGLKHCLTTSMSVVEGQSARFVRVSWWCAKVWERGPGGRLQVSHQLSLE